MYNYDRAVVALQAKCMFWLLTAHIKDDLFLERIRHSIRSHMANIWERSAHTISLIHCRNRLLTLIRATGIQHPSF